MSAYIQQEYDFIKRTREILLQYEDYFKDKDKSKKYDVTLLLNAFVGLLILPQQEWFDRLPQDLISKEKWGIDPFDITFIKEGEQKTVKTIARHLRNSVSHYKFKAFKNENEEIGKIHFSERESQILCKPFGMDYIHNSG